jgi:uncharacterized protein YbjT (DUF2867 family)
MPPPAKELRVIIFGASGMIGAGVLNSCLEDKGVSAVLAVNRKSLGIQNPKFKEIIHSDFYDYKSIETELTGYNACLFTLGVSSAGMNEKDYTRVTYDLTLAAAETLLRLNPGMSFAYVTGQGTDSTEKGKSMWARVKGRTENRLLAMDFHPATMFRPGGVQAMKGVQPRVPLYRLFYALMGPAIPFLVKQFPGAMTTSERLGRAMLKAARGEAGMSILNPIDINRVGAES